MTGVQTCALPIYLTQLEVYKTASFSFSLSFASLTNPFNLPNGFSFPIIEVYIADPEQQGSTTLLLGSDMTLPKGASWKYAFKLSGDHVQVFEATSQGIEDIKGIEGISRTIYYPAHA